jgi:hypothetical protein
MVGAGDLRDRPVLPWLLFRNDRDQHQQGRTRLGGSDKPRAARNEWNGFRLQSSTQICPGEYKMRTFSLGILAVTTVFLSVGPATSQRLEIGPGGVHVYNGRGGQCEELRRSCEFKGELGERGEGNCRRYREVCQRPVRRESCGALRAACMNKDRLGEQGEGNCRRYREACG